MAIKKINTDLQIEAGLLDGDGNSGSSNQVLISTGTGIDWVDGSGSGIIGGPYLPLAGGTMTGRLIIDTDVAGDGGWDDAGILLRNDGSPTGEVSIAFDNTGTGDNYWIQGLNQTEILKWAYGTAFTDGNQKMQLTSTGNLTVTGTINASNFSGTSSGTNTGDQDLSGYLLNTTDTFTGKLTISSTGDEMLVLQDSDNTGVGSTSWISFKDSAGTRQGYVGIGSGGNSKLYLEGIGGIQANNSLGVNGALSASGNITGANLSGTNTGDQDLSGYALINNTPLFTFDSTANLASPDAESGTWTDGGVNDWGNPRIGTSVSVYNDNDGQLEFNIPTGIKTAYLSHLTWSSGGYLDVYGKQADGDLIFLRRINTKQSIENSNHGDIIDHDGSAIVFIGHVGDYPSIRIINKSGRAHLTGLGWSKSELVASEGTGIVNYAQLTGTAPTWNQNTTGTAATASYVAGGNVDGAVASATNADTVDGVHASYTRNSANTIPVRDGSGYLNLGWINTTSGNTTNTITDVYVNTNDGYIRKATPAHFRSEITDGAYVNTTGDTMTGTLTFNNSTNTKINLNDSNAYWLATATNWGLYWNTSNNQLQFHGAGNTRGYIDLDNGRLGISEHLLAGGNVYSSGNEGFVFGSSTGDGEYIKRSGNDIQFFAGGSVRMTVDGDVGSVGIGTTSPSSELHVSGTGTVARLQSDSTYVDLLLSSNLNSGFLNLDNDKMNLYVGGGSSGDLKMSILNNGNVGIGTNSPSSKLEVYGSGSTILDIQGSQGQLFSVTDDLTGTLFTVSDISGIPIFEVDASGESSFDGNVTVNGSRVLTIADEGSGNGIDADTLDSVQGSSFLRSDTNDSFTGQLTMSTQKALIASNYGHGAYGVYSSTRLQHLWSMGTSYNLNSSGTDSGNLYGIAWSHPNAGTIGGANNLASHGMLILESGTWKGAWGGGSLRTPGDVRAPIFYDLDNTAYYLDPAGTSNLNGITSQGTSDFRAKRHNFGLSTNWDAIGFANATNLHMQGHNQFWIGAGNGTWFTGTANAKTQESGLAADATSAHDLLITTMQSTSTTDRGITFGVDTNGAGTDGWRLGKWHSGDSRAASLLAVDGTIFAKGGYTDEYDYYGNDYSQYYSSGKPGWPGDTNSGWHKPSLVASSAIQIQSGNASTNSRKPQIQFHQYGYGGPGIEYDGPNKTMTLGELGTSNPDRINSFNFRFDNTNRAIINSDYMFHNSDMRSPIFYDSEDTGYYLNPASQSHLNTLTLAGNRIGFINTAFDAEIRVSDGNPNGAGAEFVFWGDGAYANAQLTAEVGYFSSSTRSPVFYDVNNTSYYLDPASTGTSATFAGIVGIGTTNLTAPTYGTTPHLAVANTSGGTLQLRDSTSFTLTGDTLGTIQFASSNVGSPYAAGNIRAIAADNSSGGASGGAHILFETSVGTTSATPTERMRITSTGNVGIGTTSPDKLLHIQFNDQATSRIRIQNTGTDGCAYDLVAGIHNSYQQGFSIYNATLDKKQFNILNNGNVGIDEVTPNAKLTVFRRDSTYAVNLSDAQSRAGLSVKSSGNFDSKLTISSGASSRQYIQGLNNAATTGRDICINPFGGNVGFGTTSPAQKVHIHSGRLLLSNSTTPMYIKVNSSYKSWVHHIGGSSEYIFAPSTAAGGETWDWSNSVSFNTSGEITANNFILRSDETLKENVEDLNVKVDAKWKSYKLKGTEETRYGVIAQELEQTNPELVSEDDKGLKSVKYIDLLIAKIAELEARLEKLEK